MSYGDECSRFERPRAALALDERERDLVTALGLALGMAPSAVIALGLRVVAASLDDAELAARVAGVGDRSSW